MQILQILPYFFSVFIYLLAICCFLPFKLKFSQKLLLSLILFINLLMIGFVFGNGGVILLIISSCIYLSFIDTNRIMNICAFIISYLFCVICDNIYSLAWDRFVYPLTDTISNLTFYTIYILSFTAVLACICPIAGKLLRFMFRKIHSDCNIVFEKKN